MLVYQSNNITGEVMTMPNTFDGVFEKIVNIF